MVCVVLLLQWASANGKELNVLAFIKHISKSMDATMYDEYMG